MSWSYEMHLQPMLSAADIEGLPFGSVFGSVPAHTVSKRHAHQDGEMFVVLVSKASVVLGDESRELGPGSVVYLSPFGFHEIRNDHDEAFDIVSVYWEHIPSAVKALEQLPPRDALPERALVFCPPPTPNGGLHLGHLAGPYVRADMLVRALRSMGRDARYITGTDDHQSYVAAAARLRGTDPADVAASEGDAIMATLRAAGVGGDRLTRPATDPEHADRIRELLARVTSSSAVTEEERETAYCPKCDLSLHQAFARGCCGHCGAASDGEICEACGSTNEARELTGLECRICGTPAVTRPERALWLDLNAYAGQLRDYLRLTYTSPDLQALVERLLDEGLPAYRLGRSSDWGVALKDGQSLDAWADLALTFLDAARAESEQGGPHEDHALPRLRQQLLLRGPPADPGLRGRPCGPPARRVRHQPVPAPGGREVLHQPGPRGLGRRRSRRGGTGRRTPGPAAERPGRTRDADQPGARRMSSRRTRCTAMRTSGWAASRL